VLCFQQGTRRKNFVRNLSELLKDILRLGVAVCAELKQSRQPPFQAPENDRDFSVFGAGLGVSLLSIG